MAKLIHPSMLSVTRSIDPSIFLFFGTHSTSKNLKSKGPVCVTLNSIRGTISNHVSNVESEMEKEKKNPNNPNLQRVEVAYLPVGCDTLIVKGSVKFLPYCNKPNSCNNDEYADAHKGFMKVYIKQGGMNVLAERYFMNIINGRILWRNKYGFNVKTEISLNNTDKIKHMFKMADIDFYNNLSVDGIQDEESQIKAREFIKMISDQLSDHLESSTCLTLLVRAISEMGENQEVYPSQEFTEKKDTGGYKVSKILAKLKLEDSNTHQAYMHSQKIGNAIRTIDTWYEKKPESPLAVEPYGVNSTQMRVCRPKNHLYTYLTKLDKLTESMRSSDNLFSENENKLSDECHFVAACFIRGGVFSKKK